LSEDGTQLFVVNNGDSSGVIVAIDPMSLAIQREIETGGMPIALSMASVNGPLYVIVAKRSSVELLEVDVNRHSITRRGPIFIP
jgi:DNA-binding beta-propeller fold protein YncE